MDVPAIERDGCGANTPMSPRAEAIRRRTLRGFTLMELVVAMLLMTAILSATWTMLNVFRDRFEKSQERVERTQLIRSLHQAIENDLAGCFIARGGRFQSPQPARQNPSFPRRSAGPNVTNATPSNGSRLSDNPQSNDGQPIVPPVDANLQGGSVSAEEPNVDSNDPTQQDVRSISISLQSDVDRVAQNEWLVNEIRFFGTASALVCDMHVPAEPLQSDAFAVQAGMPAGTSNLSQLTQEPERSLRSADPEGENFGRQGDTETAEIPEGTRRVVYLFTDPETAVRTGRAGGLIRCELTNRQLAAIRMTATDRMDLFAVVQPVTGVPMKPDERTLKDTSSNAAEGLAAEVDLGSDLAMNGSPGREQGASLAAGTQMPVNFMPPTVDYVPEIKAFRLRYHDGSGWRDTWDSREQRELPVAVEVRFRFDVPPAPGTDPQRDANAADNGGDGMRGPDTAMDSGIDEQPAGFSSLDATDDDRMRSSQTRRVEDHRYVILLMSPPKIKLLESLSGSSDEPGKSPSEEGLGAEVVGGEAAGEVQP